MKVNHILKKLFLCFIVLALFIATYSFYQMQHQDASQDKATALFIKLKPIDRMELVLQEMTLEEKVGQMFIARCPNTNALDSISTYRVGGYILFGQDFKYKTKETVIHTIQSYQDQSKISLFIGVDEEGGTVNRISTNPLLKNQPFASPQDLYSAGGMPLIVNDTVEKCNLLKELGVNVNFAPVCDISTNPNDFIYKRSFGKDANQTAKYIQQVTKTMKENNVGSVLKHFPGYGNNKDTHTGIAYDNRPYEQFLSSDFLPFQSGIQAGANFVLVSHNVVTCMDATNPASLSPKVHEILRNDLSFNGVILTDDLAMEGVQQFASKKDVAIQAVLAGNDLLCCTDFTIQIPAVIEAVRNGTISEDKINESVLRILHLKQELKLI